MTPKTQSSLPSIVAPPTRTSQRNKRGHKSFSKLRTRRPVDRRDGGLEAARSKAPRRSLLLSHLENIRARFVSLKCARGPQQHTESTSSSSSTNTRTHTSPILSLSLVRYARNNLVLEQLEFRSRMHIREFRNCRAPSELARRSGPCSDPAQRTQPRAHSRAGAAPRIASCSLCESSTDLRCDEPFPRVLAKALHSPPNEGTRGGDQPDFSRGLTNSHHSQDTAGSSACRGLLWKYSSDSKSPPEDRYRIYGEDLTEYIFVPSFPFPYNNSK